MNTARTLSIAAIAAFASLGAQAADLNGNLYGTDFESQTRSLQSRADVHAGAVQAVGQFKNFYAERPAAQPAVAVTRSQVREQAVTAARAGQIATGNFS